MISPTITPGVQLEIFQGRGGFAKLGHFNENFVKLKTQEKRPCREILEPFLLDVLKTTLWMEYLTQK